MMTKCCAILLLLFLALVAVSADPKLDPHYFEEGGLAGGQGASKEEVKERFEARRSQLQKMIDAAKSKLEKHHAGEEVIDDQEELSRVESEMEHVQVMLEHLEDMGEKGYDPIHRREERRWARRRSRSYEL